MKAFRVLYDGPSYSGFTLIVLVDNENEVENALQEKSLRKYLIGNPYCKIQKAEEIPLSKVTISDLSITEFLKLQADKKSKTDETGVNIEIGKTYKHIEESSNAYAKVTKLTFDEKDVLRIVEFTDELGNKRFMGIGLFELEYRIK